MKKKLLLRLCLIMSAILALSSCIHDEVYSSSDPSSTEYTNKTLWKQDEKYIKNVMDVYSENENDIRKGSGVPLWDYATTVESFDESFLMVPVVEDNKVVSVLQVPRKGDKVHFYYTNFAAQIYFFQDLVFAKHKKAITRENSTAAKSISCTTQTIATWYPADESNPDSESGEGSWGTRTIIICRELLEDCVSIIDEFGQCSGGGGDDPGYLYPGGGGDIPPKLPPRKNPCEKIKEQNSNQTFKDKITNLKTKTGNSSESGFRVGSPVQGSGQTETQYQELSNKPGTNELEFKIFNTTYGIMHSHYDGLVAMFSPGDINLFIQLLQNAQAHNIPLSEVFLSVVTSQGTYQLRGDGIDVASLSMYTDAQIESFNTIYSEKMGNPSISKTDLQKEFLKFMKANMNIDGAKLYETDSDGKSEQLVLNGNSLSTPDCP